MRKRLWLSHACAVLVGGAFVIGVALLKDAPSTWRCSPFDYVLETPVAQISAYEVESQLIQAEFYLTLWPYTFQSRKGLALLDALAEQGVVLAMVRYATYTMHDNRGWLATQKQRYALVQRGLYWARKAADMGQPIALARFMIPSISPLPLNHMEEQDIQRLKAHAPTSRFAAGALARYYEALAQNGTESAALEAHHWHALFDTISEEEIAAERAQRMVLQEPYLR